ncbi:phage tail sheath protein [Sorangium sp. So ce1389]|uniref:phage tail sheath protein n=1 Tax=Sorangium sp. So ce1389 TaxID=3133336 RepID=UPI003F61E69F
MRHAAYGLTFESFSPVERTHHFRADVALFVGFVTPRRAGKLERPSEEAPLRAWLRERGFDDQAREIEARALSVATLAQVPIPVEGWSHVEALFAWDRRPIQEGVSATTYLGAALRAFFAQGGRKAYVVRAGDPWEKRAELGLSPGERAKRREERLGALVPTASPGSAPSPVARASWRGIAHVFGLPDVSFVVLPDLPDILDARTALAPVTPPAAEQPEVFAECSAEVASPAGEDTILRQMPPPACDGATLERWAEVVSEAVSFLRRHRPESELVAAIPLTFEPAAPVSERNPLARFYEEKWLRTRQPSLGGTAPRFEGFTSALLQLGYPWVRTLGSASVPGDAEPPDGAIAGLLARNALLRGTYRSAAGLPVPFVYDLVPDLGRSTLLEPVDAGTDDLREALCLLQRVCVIGLAPSGMQLLSDVTTSADESYRTAGASRLLGAVLRAAASVGEDIAFEPSGEATWAHVRDRMDAMLLDLWQMGALRGATPAEAFLVRCDRSTMTQADLDAGRVVVHVQMEITAAVEALRVSLSLAEGGRVSLLSAEAGR